MCARNQEIILWSSAGTLQLFKIFLGENLLTTLSGDQILVSSTYASDATSVRFHGPLSDDQLLVFFELCFRCISALQIFHYASDAISAHQVLKIFSGRTPNPLSGYQLLQIKSFMFRCNPKLYMHQMYNFLGQVINFSSNCASNAISAHNIQNFLGETPYHTTQLSAQKMNVSLISNLYINVFSTVEL